ncbi:MAG: SUMF1/EgtB/PvdO family nonheme iron enzyme [Candidatus Polarisedimenticolia bacterium]
MTTSIDLELRAARRRTDEVLRLVSSEGLLERPIDERHRGVFYLGHLEAFDRNLLAAAAPGPADPGHAGFDRLFAFGIDPVDGTLPDDRPEDWPPPGEVQKWAVRARLSVDALIERAEIDPMLLHAVIEHRLMHAETLVYLLRRMPLHRMQVPAGAPAPVLQAVRDVSGSVEIPAGEATLGLPAPDRGVFGWDNERAEHRVDVPAFVIDRSNVTCRDWLRFVQEGGYDDRSLWTRPAWSWKERIGLTHPQGWRPSGTGPWTYRATFGEIPLPLEWPVLVSHAEASAYARWRGALLPTEAQFHRAAYGAPGGGERAYPWGDEAPTARHGNFDFARWDPVPVGSFPEGDSAFGVVDLAGNGWEWTRTPFQAFEGFVPLPFYPGYSADFFSGEHDGAHRVLKGGGTRTASRLLRRSFRNWFQPHYTPMEAAFRCVEP